MSVLLSALLAALGAGSFLVAFEAGDLLLPMAIAAAVGAVASQAVTGWARRGSALAWLAALTALAGAGLATGSAEPAGLTDGLLTMVRSPAPLDPEPLLLTFPFLCAGLAAFLGAELAQRSTASVTPVVPSLVVLVTGLVVGGDDLVLPSWVPLAWTAAALMLVGWRSREASQPRASRRASPQRRLLIGRLAVVASLAVLLAVGVGSLGERALAGQDRDRFVLEDDEEPEVAEELLGFNPLTRVTALQSSPDDVAMFNAEASGSTVQFWRLTVLDAYDGTAWTAADLELTSGSDELPPLPVTSAPDPDLLDGDPLEVEQTVQLTAAGVELLGGLLPVVGQPIEADAGDGLLFHLESGTLAYDGDPPDSYQVVSELGWPDASRLPNLQVADDPEAEAALSLPDSVPEEFTGLATEITEGIESDWERAVAIEQFLRNNYQLAVEEPPTGHSFGHLTHFLSSQSSAAGQGSAEQFAASYALLARLSGLPTRIVVGFDGLGASGQHVVTARTATAWAEVKFEGLGWVTIDPVPELAGGGSGEMEVAGSDEPPPDELTGDDVDEDADEDGDDAGPAGAASEGDGPNPLVFVAAALVAMALLVMVIPVVLRARRRRRRQSAPDPAGRIAGAWAAAIDVLRVAGVPATRDLGALDVVAVTGHHLDEVTEPLGQLGNLVNDGLFAATPPGDRAAHRAWDLSDQVRKGYRRSRGLRRAVRDHFRL